MEKDIRPCFAHAKNAMSIDYKCNATWSLMDRLLDQNNQFQNNVDIISRDYNSAKFP